MSLRTAAVLAALFISLPIQAGEIIYGYNGVNGNLVSFDSTNPGVLLSNTPLSGLVTGEFSGEVVKALDFRPATGQLFALMSNFSNERLATINTATGAVTGVGASVATGFFGDSGFDFSPAADRSRDTDAGGNRNIRRNPNDGTFATDTALAYAPGDPNAGSNPNVSHIAYSPLTANGATLYGIDTALGALVRIGGVDGNPSPNGGLLTTIGLLGLNFSLFDLGGQGGGFDISQATGIGYLSLTHGGTSTLYTINLQTGAATTVGGLGRDVAITALSVAPAAAAVPEPSSFALVGAMLGFGLLIRRKTV